MLYLELLNGTFDLYVIGGSVLRRLLDHLVRDTFEITALVRNVDKANLLNTWYQYCRCILL